MDMAAAAVVVLRNPRRVSFGRWGMRFSGVNGATAYD